MRINKFVASASDLSRRGADAAVASGRVLVNGKPAEAGQEVSSDDQVTLDGHSIHAPAVTETIMLNKPIGYVVSRNGQGSKTVYDLLPAKLHHLNPVGRLDKESSGLLILTNDGALAEQLTHPRYEKEKVYEVRLNKPLRALHHQMISDYGVQLTDGPSKFLLERLQQGDDFHWRVRIREGRNRQIRRTFAALDYSVQDLHRTHFGDYALGKLRSGSFESV